MIKPISFLLFFLLSSCVVQHKEDHKTSIAEEFPNILNYKGIPAAKEDRSVFMFSDLGAWHGYGLPDSTFPGTYTGPFLMTMENGIWLSKALSKFAILDSESRKSLDLREAMGVQINSYPNKLSQSFSLPNLDLEVQTDLIFLSDRTAMMSYSVMNKGTAINKPIQIKWSADTLFKEIVFTVDSAGIDLDFDHFGHSAYISGSVDLEFTANSHSYFIISKPVSIAPGESYHTFLTHSVVFNKKEAAREERLIKEVNTNLDSFLSFK